MSVKTSAVVEVTLELDMGSDAWNEEEPGLDRAFRYAKEGAVARLNRVFSGHANRADISRVKLLKLGPVAVTVTQGEAPADDTPTDRDRLTSIVVELLDGLAGHIEELRGRYGRDVVSALRHGELLDHIDSVYNRRSAQEQSP